MLQANEIDMTGYRRAMNSVYDALLGSGQDISNVVQDEGKRLNRAIVNFAPPNKSSKWGAAKTSGEMAIRAELTSLISEADELMIDTIGSAHGLHNINTYITGADGDKTKLIWENIDPMGARIEEYHHRYQNRRGKIGRQRAQEGTWRSRVVVPKGTREPYINKVLARVGRAKASIALAGQKLGGNFPRWISRHFGSVGDIAIVDVSAVKHATHPSLTFGSRAPGISRIQERTQAAVRTRTKQMLRRVKLILSGYNKDLAAGMKATARARNNPPQQEELAA